MVAHTGFLIFGRKIEISDDPRAVALLAELSLDEESVDSSPGDIQEEVVR
jgi:hypothetical protein